MFSVTLVWHRETSDSPKELYRSHALIVTYPEAMLLFRAAARGVSQPLKLRTSPSFLARFAPSSTVLDPCFNLDHGTDESELERSDCTEVLWPPHSSVKWSRRKGLCCVIHP